MDSEPRTLVATRADIVVQSVPTSPGHFGAFLGLGSTFPTATVAGDRGLPEPGQGPALSPRARATPALEISNVSVRARGHPDRALGAVVRMCEGLGGSSRRQILFLKGAGKCAACSMKTLDAFNLP